MQSILPASSKNRVLLRIDIPREFHGKALTDYQLSTRLYRVFTIADLQVLGDLHGMSLSKFAKLRNCGSKTVRELCETILTPLGSLIDPNPPYRQATFSVPEHARNLELADLPVSERLSGVAKAAGASSLGDFHGRAPLDLRAYQNCGARTIDEIHELISRAASGKFNVDECGEAEAPSKLLTLVESALAKLPPRERQVMLDRAGRHGLPPQTLEQIGRPLRMTREAIRITVLRAIGKVRTMWGPQIPRLLDMLAARCLKTVCPLTPQRLTAWLGGNSPESALTPSGQVRLIGLLNERAPCWPEGHDGIGLRDAKTNPFEKTLAKIVSANGSRISLVDAFRQMRKQPDQRRLDESEFLSRLRRMRRLFVDFPDPEHPSVRLGKLTIAYFAPRVLEESDEPLTPEEIHRQAILRFGPDRVRCKTRSIDCGLRCVPGIYLIGPQSFGTQKHFHLPPAGRKRIRNAFVRLLERENRQISTYEVVNDRLLRHLNGAGPEEVASILREDPRLTDLGHFFFSLRKWKVQKRKPLRILIAETLRKANRLLNAKELRALLRRLRSVAPSSIHATVLTCPELRNFGRGRFGLASWGDEKLSPALENLESSPPDRSDAPVATRFSPDERQSDVNATGSSRAR